MTAPADSPSSGVVRLGVSSCLLGNPVRYDGGHKLDRYLCDTLGRFVEYVPVCPEVECGLPVPREAMRLVGDPGAPRLVTRDGGHDLTDRLLTRARRPVRDLEAEGVCGFVFKGNSPSSGMAPVVVPVTLLNHYVRKSRQPNLAGPVYLNPLSAEQQLRNLC